MVTHPRIGDSPSRIVADALHRTWIAFVADGTPGWAPYTTGDRTTALLAHQVTEVHDPAGDERRLWDGIR